MAQVLARAGLHLGATTIRRMVLERGGPPEDEPQSERRRRRSFKRGCKRREIRPRYGRIGEPASIAIVERFIRSMKNECTRRVLVPLSLAEIRRELRFYATWYDEWRTHMALAGKTPREVYEGRAGGRR
jgi:transposase InsO family protein